ncbi:DUF4326 domain-containing protein [Micromonospora taraxaci]|uniref:DUF4326 domain-containing protein n=1 Tax=Micromonospora taraxaci TaxID=1316803 RepID=UPI0033FD7386
MPTRIQRRRTAGWRMPTGAVYVGRPTKYGNPYVPSQRNAECRGAAVQAYRRHVAEHYDLAERARAELAGRDLACWCPLDQPCHADVLLELANAPAETVPYRPHRDEPSFDRPITTVHLPAANIA